MHGTRIAGGMQHHKRPNACGSCHKGVALGLAQSRPLVSDSFPEALRRGVRDMSSFAAPLLLLRAARTCRHLLRRGAREKVKPVRRSISESGALKSLCLHMASCQP